MKYEIIKGSEKDFEGAPDWCMFILGIPAFSDRVFVEALSRGTRHQFIGSESVSQNSDLQDEGNHYIIAERRPITEPVWDGAGVPCVGQKVMTKSGEGIIDYVGSGVIVYSDDDGQWSVRCDSLDYALSAIRSPEDVARDKAIEAMRDVGYTLPAAIRFTKEEMSALYDAGYRKME